MDRFLRDELVPRCFGSRDSLGLISDSALVDP